MGSYSFSSRIINSSLYVTCWNSTSKFDILSKDQLFKDSQICSKAEIHYILTRAYLWKAHTSKNFFIEKFNEFSNPLQELPSCFWISHHYFIYFFFSFSQNCHMGKACAVSLNVISQDCLNSLTFGEIKWCWEQPLGFKGKLNQEFY